MLTSIEFCKTNLFDISSSLIGTTFEYYTDVQQISHFVVVQLRDDVQKDEYLKIEDSFSDKFYTLFPYENLSFVTNDIIKKLVDLFFVDCFDFSYFGTRQIGQMYIPKPVSEYINSNNTIAVASSSSQCPINPLFTLAA